MALPVHLVSVSVTGVPLATSPGGFAGTEGRQAGTLVRSTRIATTHTDGCGRGARALEVLSRRRTSGTFHTL